MNKKIFRFIINIILYFPILITVGCISIVTYEEPKSGPVARVRFVSDSDSDIITVVRSYESRECNQEREMMRLRKGVLFSSDPRRLGIPLDLYHKNATQEFRVRAGIPQIYLFDASKMIYRTIYSCGVIIESTFEEGKDYELSYKWHSSACHVKVYEIKTDSSGITDKILLYKKDNTLPSDFSKACLVKFKKLRLY